MGTYAFKIFTISIRYYNRIFIVTSFCLLQSNIQSNELTLKKIRAVFFFKMQHSSIMCPICPSTFKIEATSRVTLNHSKTILPQLDRQTDRQTEGERDR